MIQVVECLANARPEFRPQYCQKERAMKEIFLNKERRKVVQTKRKILEGLEEASHCREM
jgi:hypothetical protein